MRLTTEWMDTPELERAWIPSLHVPYSLNCPKSSDLQSFARHQGIVGTYIHMHMHIYTRAHTHTHAYAHTQIHAFDSTVCTMTTN